MLTNKSGIGGGPGCHTHEIAPSWQRISYSRSKTKSPSCRDNDGHQQSDAAKLSSPAFEEVTHGVCSSSFNRTGNALRVSAWTALISSDARGDARTVQRWHDRYNVVPSLALFG
jgi:hypothetical protein